MDETALNKGFRATLQAAKQENKIAYLNLLQEHHIPKLPPSSSGMLSGLGLHFVSFLDRMSYEHRDR